LSFDLSYIYDAAFAKSYVSDKLVSKYSNNIKVHLNNCKDISL